MSFEKTRAVTLVGVARSMVVSFVTGRAFRGAELSCNK